MSIPTPQTNKTVGFFLRIFDHLVIASLAVFALGVILLCPGYMFALRIAPSVLLGAGLLALMYFLREHGMPTHYYIPLEAVGVPIIVMAGIGIRVVIALFVHPKHESDYQAYWDSAVHLFRAHEYVIFDYFDEKVALLRAYRPPGAAFLVSLAMRITGENIWAPLCVNLTCFAATAFLIADVCRSLFTNRAASFAALLLSAWPSDILMSGLAQSEAPAILATAVCIWLTVIYRRNAWLWATATGVVTGLSCLVRNSNLIFVPLFFLMALREPWRWRKRLAAMLLLLASTLGMIAPWTLRNYIVLGKPVIVATNGGENFYTANNQDGDGSWTHESAARIRKFLPDELLMDKMGFALAKEWILNHPFRFMALAVPKFRVLTRSDDHGPYWALERGRGYAGKWLQLTRWFADLWWILLWSLVLYSIVDYRKWYSDRDLVFLATITIVPEILFLIFLAAERYHVVMVPPAICIAAYSLSARGTITVPQREPWASGKSA